MRVGIAIARAIAVKSCACSLQSPARVRKTVIAFGMPIEVRFRSESCTHWLIRRTRSSGSRSPPTIRRAVATMALSRGISGSGLSARMIVSPSAPV